MERSNNGYIEKMDKRSTRKADAVRAVIRGLVLHHAVAPVMVSEHFSGEPAAQEITPVSDRSDGWDGDGNYYTG